MERCRTNFTLVDPPGSNAPISITESVRSVDRHPDAVAGAAAADADPTATISITVTGGPAPSSTTEQRMAEGDLSEHRHTRRGSRSRAATLVRTTALAETRTSVADR